MKSFKVASAGLSVLLFSVACAAEPSLTAVAQSSSMIWNAVAVAKNRIYVAGPRWTGSKGPALGRIDKTGSPAPYPDAAWNGWHDGADPSAAFVDVNAIHLDGKGSLWVIDTGSPQFGGDPLPGGAKLVQIALSTGRVTRIIHFGPDIALPGSYVDDVRFHDHFAYLTDAGKPGLIVLDLVSGAMRRLLEDIPATTAPANRPIVVASETVRAPDGRPLGVNADPMEVSPDGEWFYFAPLEGPWSRIATHWLEDFSLSPDIIATHVEPWVDLPPVGGTAMDANGDLYFTDLAASAVKRRKSDGTIQTIVQDDRLHWIDAPVIDEKHRIWLPVAQMDRTPPFNGGASKTQWPITLYRLPLPTTP